WQYSEESISAHRNFLRNIVMPIVITIPGSEARVVIKDALQKIKTVHSYEPYSYSREVPITEPHPWAYCPNYHGKEIEVGVEYIEESGVTHRSKLDIGEAEEYVEGRLGLKKSSVTKKSPGTRPIIPETEEKYILKRIKDASENPINYTTISNSISDLSRRIEELNAENKPTGQLEEQISQLRFQQRKNEIYVEINRLIMQIRNGLKSEKMTEETEAAFLRLVGELKALLENMQLSSAAHYEKYFIDRKNKFGYFPETKTSLAIRGENFAELELSVTKKEFLQILTKAVESTPLSTQFTELLRSTDLKNVVTGRDAKGALLAACQEDSELYDLVNRTSVPITWEGTTLLGLDGINDAQDGVEYYEEGRQLTTFEGLIPIIFGLTQRLKTASETGARMRDTFGSQPALSEVVVKSSAPLREAVQDRYVAHTERLGDDASREPVRSRLGKRFLVTVIIASVAIFLFGAIVFPNLNPDFFPAVHEAIASTGKIRPGISFSFVSGMFFLAKNMISLIFFTVTITMFQKLYLSTTGAFNKSGLIRVLDNDIGKATPDRRMAEAVAKLRDEGEEHFQGVKTKTEDRSYRRSEDITRELSKSIGMQGFLEKSKKPMNVLRKMGPDGADPFFFVYLNSVSRKELIEALERVENLPNTLSQYAQDLRENSFRLNGQIVFNNEDIVETIETTGADEAERIYQALRTDRRLFIHIARCTPLFGEPFILETVNVRNLRTDYPNLTVWPALVEHDQKVTDRFTELINEGAIPEGIYAFLSSQMGAQKQNLRVLDLEEARQRLARGESLEDVTPVAQKDRRIKEGWDMIERLPETKSVATGYAISAMETISELLNNQNRLQDGETVVLGLPDFSETGAPEVFEILDAEDRANVLQPWSIAIGFKKINTIVSYLQEIVEREGYDAIRPRNLRRNHRELLEESQRWGVDLLLLQDSLKQFKGIREKLARAAHANTYIEKQKYIFEQSLLSENDFANLESEEREKALERAFVLSEMRARLSPAVLQGVLRLNPLGDNPFTTQDYGPWNMIKRGLVAQRTAISAVTGIIAGIGGALLGFALLSFAGTFIAFIGGFLGASIGFRLGLVFGGWAVLKLRNTAEWIERRINKASPFPYDGTTNSFWLEKLVGRNMRTGEQTFRGKLEHDLYELKKELYELGPQDREAVRALEFMGTFTKFKTLGIHDSNDIIEDAKLGSLCSKYGYRNMIIADYATETFEANLPELGYEWWYQRSRWITITPIAVMLKHMPDFLAFFGSIIGMGFGGALLGTRIMTPIEAWGGLSWITGIGSGFIGVGLGFVLGGLLGYGLGVLINTVNRKLGRIKYPEQDTSFIRQAGPHNFFQLIFLLFGKPATAMTTITYGTTGMLALVLLLYKLHFLGGATSAIMAFTPPLFWFIVSIAAGIVIFIAPSYIIFEMSLFGALLSGPDNESLVRDGLDRMKETAEKFQNYKIGRELKKLGGILKYGPDDRDEINKSIGTIRGLLYELSPKEVSEEEKERRLFDRQIRGETDELVWEVSDLLNALKNGSRDLNLIRQDINRIAVSKSKTLNPSLGVRVSIVDSIDSELDKFALNNKYTYKDFLKLIDNMQKKRPGIKPGWQTEMFDDAMRRFRQEVESNRPGSVEEATNILNKEIGLINDAVSDKITDMRNRYNEVTAGKITFGSRTFMLAGLLAFTAFVLYRTGLAIPMVTGLMAVVSVILFTLWGFSKAERKIALGMMPYFYLKQTFISLQISGLYFLHMIPAAKITLEQLWARRDNWWSRTSHDEREVLREARETYPDKVRESMSEFKANVKDIAKKPSIKRIVTLLTFGVSASSLALMLRFPLFRDWGVVIFGITSFVLLWRTLMLRFNEDSKSSFKPAAIGVEKAGIVLAVVGLAAFTMKLLGHPIYAASGYTELFVAAIGVGALLALIFTPKKVRKQFFMNVYNKWILYVLVLGPAIGLLIFYPLQEKLLDRRKERFIEDRIAPVSTIYYTRAAGEDAFIWELINGVPATEREMEDFSKLHEDLANAERIHENRDDVNEALIQAFKECQYPVGPEGLAGWITWNADRLTLKAGVVNGLLDVETIKAFYEREIETYPFDLIRVKKARAYLRIINDIIERNAKKDIKKKELNTDLSYIKIQLEAYRQLLDESDDHLKEFRLNHLLDSLEERLERAGVKKPQQITGRSQKAFEASFYTEENWTTVEYVAADIKKDQARSNAVDPADIKPDSNKGEVRARINLFAIERDRRDGNVVVLNLRDMIGRPLEENEHIALKVEIPQSLVAVDTMRSLSLEGVWSDATGKWQHGAPQLLNAENQEKIGINTYTVNIKPLSKPDGYLFGYYSDKGFNPDYSIIQNVGVRIMLSKGDRDGEYIGEIVIKGYITKKADIKTTIDLPEEKPKVTVPAEPIPAAVKKPSIPPKSLIPVMPVGAVLTRKLIRQQRAVRDRGRRALTLLGLQWLIAGGSTLTGLIAWLGIEAAITISVIGIAAIIAVIVSRYIKKRPEELALLKETSPVASQNISHIENMYRAVKEPSAGYKVVIVACPNEEMANFWQDRLDNLKGQVVNKNAHVFAIPFPKDWDGAGGQLLVTLYMWQEAKRRADEQGIENLQQIMDNDSQSIAIYHTIGKGTRTYPAPGVEVNSKAAVQIPNNVVIDGEGIPETMLESAIFASQILARTRENRLSVFWTDHFVVPSEDMACKDTHHVEMFSINHEIPDNQKDWEKEELDQYGLNIHDRQTGDVQVKEKFSWENAKKLLIDTGVISPGEKHGISLGSHTYSREFLEALENEYGEYLPDPERGRKGKGFINTDPDVWMPITSPEGQFAETAKTDEEKLEKIALWKRVNAFKDEFLTKSRVQGDTRRMIGFAETGLDTWSWDFGKVIDIIHNF
ncbi:MAG: hypothetical protein HQ579_03840, partial [Candidatus Omnitrophica bacterium]|nr:hypothetical protein [Candidatus Omnitrophota bacterium]